MRGRTERLRYGNGRHQFGVLHQPRSGVRSTAVVMLVHGGFWRWPYNRLTMSLLVRDAVRRGFTVFNVAYRRLGRFGGGGGWPETFDDVTDAATLISDRFVDAPLMLIGHSAGGHLALVAAARLPERIDGVVAMSAPTDLRALSESGSEPVDALVARAPRDRRWSSTSPIEMVPSGVRTLCVHGDADTTVDPVMSARYVEAARAAGDDADLILVPGEGHRSPLLAGSRTWQAVLESLHRWTSDQSAGSRSGCDTTMDGG